MRPVAEATPCRCARPCAHVDPTKGDLGWPRSAPKGTKSLPKGAESLPKGVKSLPKRVESLHDEVESLPKGVDSLHDELDSLAKGLAEQAGPPCCYCTRPKAGSIATSHRGLQQARRDARKEAGYSPSVPDLRSPWRWSKRCRYIRSRLALRAARLTLPSAQAKSAVR